MINLHTALKQQAALFSSFILMMMIVHIIVSSLFYPAAKYQAWQTVKENCHKEQLVELTLSIEDFHLSRVNQHEVKWKGEWYDIEEMQEFDNYVVLFARQDNHESKLLDFFLGLLNKNKSSQQNLSLNSSYIVNLFESIMPDHQIYLVVDFPSNYHNYIALYTRFIEQPPEC